MPPSRTFGEGNYNHGAKFHIYGNRRRTACFRRGGHITSRRCLSVRATESTTIGTSTSPTFCSNRHDGSYARSSTCPLQTSFRRPAFILNLVQRLCGLCEGQLEQGRHSLGELYDRPTKLVPLMRRVNDGHELGTELLNRSFRLKTWALTFSKQ